jgi:VWFA-related protein
MKLERPKNGFALFFSLTILVGIFLLVGCGGGGGGDGGGESGTPDIALDRNSIDFGNQVIGQTADRSLTVLNTGNGDLVIGGIAADQPSPFSNYAAADTCSNQTLRPNTSCSIVVRFEPEVYGDFSGSLVIPSNAGDDRTVNLAGNGRDLKVTITKVDTRGWDEIKLTVSVTDVDNEPVTGLVAGNFSVTEEGNDVGVESLNQQIATPILVALTLDDSGSISDFFKGEIADASKGFIDLMNLSPDEAAVIKFDSQVDVKQGFTDDRDALLLAVDSPYSLDRVNGTRFYTAVSESVTMVRERLAVKPSYNGAVIVISDGLDRDSTETLQQVIDDAVEDGVLVNTFGFGDNLQSGIMKELADETGGLYLPAPSGADLEDAYLTISNVLGNQYEITFTTLKPIGSVNELTVVVDDGQRRGDDTLIVTY